MLNTRQYKNNLGFQIQVDRPHPIFAWDLDRFNKNTYHYDGYNTTMRFNRGREEGLQYGGKSKKNCDCSSDKQDNCECESIQSGNGLDPQTIYKTLQLLYTGAKTIPKIYSSEPATIVKNTYGKFMNSNPNWRPGFAGEKHLLSKKGLTYNYCGPGTNLAARLERGDPGLDNDGLDLVCKTHDIEYGDSKNWNDVRKADKNFIKNVDKTTIGNNSKKFIKGLFKAKIISENVGFTKPSTFANFPNIQDEIPKKIQDEQPSINISGKGKMFLKNHDPARKLKNKIKKYRTKKQTDKLMKIAVLSIKKRLKK